MERMAIFVGLCAAAAAVAAQAPAPPRPFPSEYREFIGGLSEAELARWRLGAWRFCSTQRREHPLACMTIQDGIVVQLVWLRRDLARDHHDPEGFIGLRDGECRRLHEDHGSGDLRILAECLNHTWWLVSDGDRVAVREGRWLPR